MRGSTPRIATTEENKYIIYMYAREAGAETRTEKTKEIKNYLLTG